MSGRPPMRRVRQIVIALSSEEADPAELQTLGRLAAEMAAEITGLFVEDVDLLHLARLPFAREISRLTSTQRRLEASEIERYLRIQAQETQRALASAAEQAGVAWSFRVTRGRVHAELLEASAEMDLVVFRGARRWPQAAGERAAASIPWRALGARMRPVTVVFDRSAAGRHALEVAARLARAEGHPLSVVLVAGTPESAERLRRAAAELLGEQPASYRRVTRRRVGALLRAVCAEAPAMVVMGADRALLVPEAIKALRAELSCPTLLVRPRRRRGGARRGGDDTD